MNGRAAPPASGSRREVPTTIIMSLAAVGMALIAIFGDAEGFGPLTISMAVLGLVAWTFVAGGVHVPTAVFAVATIVPAAIIVVVAGNPGGMFPALIAVVWVTRSTGDWRVVVPSVLAPLVAIAVLAADKSSAHETGMVYFMGGVAISAMSGLMLRRQERLLDEVRALGELRSDHAAAAERTRIAREVHDVVAHSLTVAMLNVGGARRALRSDPALADQALERAETVGRDSLDSIRRVVGLLRDGSGSSGTAAPMPGLGAVIDLVDGYRVAGLEIELELCSDAGEIEPTIGLVVYRVIQESLSNVVHHSPGASTTVGLTAMTADDADALRVTISSAGGSTSTSTSTNRRNPDRSGLGLTGMAERVRAVGGELAAGPRPDGGWQVEATIPLRSTAAVSANGDT